MVDIQSPTARKKEKERTRTKKDRNHICKI